MADSSADLDDIQVRKKPAWLLPAIGALLIMVAGAGGYFAGTSSQAATPEVAADGTSTVSGDASDVDATAQTTEVTSLGSFTVNLRDGAGSRLLQMEISVESDTETAEVVASNIARLRDTVLLLASDYSTVELEGMDAKLRLRDEIHRRINAVLAPARVSRVYFTAFVVQ